MIPRIFYPVVSNSCIVPPNGNAFKSAISWITHAGISPYVFNRAIINNGILGICSIDTYIITMTNDTISNHQVITVLVCINPFSCIFYCAIDKRMRMPRQLYSRFAGSFKMNIDKADIIIVVASYNIVNSGYFNI